MGWNSWDSFATTVTEAQIKAQTDYMADKLARYGWEYIVVDIQWYEPGATGFIYRPNAQLVMDGYGRLLPAPNKFPSATEGMGFTALADYVRDRGLKFGIHLMRGIPRQAVMQNTPVFGTRYRAADIADTTSVSTWNTDMFGVDMTKPGAQEYYNSVFQQIADWGVDFVKIDDLSRPYHQAEVEAIRRAIDRTGRPILLSTSPGETPLLAGDHVSRHANMWRMSDDFWDTWPALLEQFERTRKWAPFIGPGHFPDADMLPLGAIRSVPGYTGGPWTRFTKDEQYTMMSLWAIARSPLIMGGDMTKNDEFTLSLLTNEEVIAVNQHSSGNQQLFSREGHIAWIANVPKSNDLYLALFNARDRYLLDESRAAFGSGLVTRETPGHAVPIVVEIKGAKKLFLIVTDGGDGIFADHANWVEPRLVGPRGELRLTDLQWKSATTGWGEVSARVGAGGQPMRVDGHDVTYGIGTHATSVIEFALPEGYTHFRSMGALDDGGTLLASGATVRFLVFTENPYSEQQNAGISVPLQDLGFRGEYRIRDLWQRKDLGHFANGFAPEVPWHGARLYRVSIAQ